MGKPKRTGRPAIPSVLKTQAALTLARIRIHKYKTRYATLWEAAADFIKTKGFKKIARIVKKDRYDSFIKNRTAQIKFVVNMFRDLPRTKNPKFGGHIIKDHDVSYLSRWPKALYQTEETGFSPPKELINLTKELDSKGKAKPNKYRLNLAKTKRRHKTSLQQRLRDKKDFKDWLSKK